MIYSATPEFVKFCRKYIGRKVTDNFVEAFCGDGYSANYSPYISSKLAINPISMKEEWYNDCYSHAFKEHGLSDGYDEFHYLWVQVQHGRIIRIFPPKIASCRVITNETFHTASYDCVKIIASPTDDDIARYSSLLDSCTIDDDICLPNDDYIDIPLISDSVRPFIRHYGPEPEDEYDEEPNFDWSWDHVLDERSIAWRRGDIADDERNKRRARHSLSEGPVCPLCGSAMILRHRRSDGEPFYGCTKFPECRGTARAKWCGGPEDDE